MEISDYIFINNIQSIAKSTIPSLLHFIHSKYNLEDPLSFNIIHSQLLTHRTILLYKNDSEIIIFKFDVTTGYNKRLFKAIVNNISINTLVDCLLKNPFDGKIFDQDFIKDETFCDNFYYII